MSGNFSETFRSTTGNVANSPRTFAERLEKSVDAYIAHGNEGINRQPLDNNGKPKGPEDKVFRKFFMDEKVFDLGCKIHAKGYELDPKLWSAWMKNTRVHNYEDRVEIYQRSAFQNHHTEQKLGPLLRKFLGENKRFIFKPDEGIKHHVEAA